MRRALLLAVLLSVAGTAYARGGNNRAPCDRGAGGVVGCKGDKFVCANGSISRSTKVCVGHPQR